MAFSLLKRVASNLSRFRTVASSSRFFSTKGYDYEFVQHDTKDECILKCEDNMWSSASRRVINDAFSPRVSPASNLGRLLNVSDSTIRNVHGTQIFPRWIVAEDDKALYILRDNTAEDIGDVRKSCMEFMTGNHKENFNETVPISEEGYISGNVKENFNEAVPISEEGYISGNVKENFNEAVPSSEEEYYYRMMKDDKEVEQFVESLDGKIHASIKIAVDKPQAVNILVELGDPQTRNPYGGYVMEIFLDDSLYSVYDLKLDFTGFKMKLFIPKKKAERTKTIGGNCSFLVRRSL